MADVEIVLEWQGEGLRFEGRGGSPESIRLDGEGVAGPTPVETLLLSLAACMAADLVDISVKSRAHLEGVEVLATGMRRPNPPRRYTSMRLVFTAIGVPPEDEPKVRRALALSEEKYCSVAHTLRPDVDVSFELVLKSATAAERGS